MELKKIIPTIPSLNMPENEVFDRQAILAEIQLIDTFDVWVKTLGNSTSLEKYRVLSEIYANEYDNHFNDISTLLTVDGVIVEMYSDIFKYEEKNGESEKSKSSKERIMVLKNGIECLRKYFTKYDEMKVMLLQSVIERGKLLKENRELKTQLENMNNAFKFE